MKIELLEAILKEDEEKRNYKDPDDIFGWALAKEFFSKEFYQECLFLKYRSGSDELLIRYLNERSSCPQKQ